MATYQNLNQKILELSWAIGERESMFSSFSKDAWKKIFTDAKDIAFQFKTVRYPTKPERDEAWQKFYDLRSRAFDLQDSQFNKIASENYSYLWNRLDAIQYSKISDDLISIMSFSLLATKENEMKECSRELNRLTKEFSARKYHMRNEDKTEIFEKINTVRSSYDLFWERNREYKDELYQEKQRKYEEGQREWEAKSRDARNRVESNIDKNKDKLYKAKSALSHFKSKRDDLQQKIWDSDYTDWIERAEGWLSEFEEKITSCEEQVERIQGWIDEGEEQLRNWN